MQYRLGSENDNDSFTQMLKDSGNVPNTTRGPTQMRNILESQRDKLVVDCNRLGQPTGENTSKLTNFIRTLVRDRKNASLHYKNWRNVPDKYKDRLWKSLRYDTTIMSNVHIQFEYIFSIALITFR